jgi:hypothetical protein
LAIFQNVTPFVGRMVVFLFVQLRLQQTMDVHYLWLCHIGIDVNELQTKQRYRFDVVLDGKFCDDLGRFLYTYSNAL